MNFRRRLREIRCLSPVCPRQGTPHSYACTMAILESMRIAALALLAAAALPAQEVSPCNNTPAYSTCELVFALSHPAAAKNPEPSKTVALKAEFPPPRHRTLPLAGSGEQ